MTITCRPALPEDAPAIQELSGQLGYTISIEATRSQLEEVMAAADHLVRVALDGETVIGWIHACKVLTIESPSFMVISGLVIKDSYRNQGIGKWMVGKVIDWCRRKNVHTLRVRSNSLRIDAHRFYQSLGFSEIKEQKVFEMKSPPHHRSDD